MEVIGPAGSVDPSAREIGDYVAFTVVLCVGCAANARRTLSGASVATMAVPLESRPFDVWIPVGSVLLLGEPFDCSYLGIVSGDVRDALIGSVVHMIRMGPGIPDVDIGPATGLPRSSTNLDEPTTPTRGPSASATAGRRRRALRCRPRHRPRDPCRSGARSCARRPSPRVLSQRRRRGAGPTRATRRLPGNGTARSTCRRCRRRL